MEAKIELLDETEDLKKELSSIIELPKEGQKQPDLQYFSAIFVSSGTNLNKAHFLPSELVMAAKSVPSKAVDVEHEESEIIGHIFDYAFVDMDGNKLNVAELSSMEKGSLDNKEMHIVIAGVIYKSRFPNLSKEVATGQWKVSMEAYYQDYDLKVGSMILDKKEAELLGYDSASENLIGKTVKVVKKGVEIASGEVARVLRGICFSGVGIVKNPANPPSVILETANKKEFKIEDGIIILDYDKVLEKATNNVTSENIDKSTQKEESKSTKEEKKDMEKSALDYNDTTGICVNYKRRVEAEDGGGAGPDTVVQHKDWCSLFDQSCTSFSRDTTDPKCLRNQAQAVVLACVEKAMNSGTFGSKSNEDLLVELESKISKALTLL